MLIHFGRYTLAATTAAGLIISAAHSAKAQSVAPPDSAAIFSMIGENSSISTAGLTDRYYTNGLSASYLSGEGAFEALNNLTQPILGDGAPRLSLGISQQIYTPDNTHVAVPPPNDRPYAGVLLANIGLSQDGENSRTSAGIGLGMVGPSALGRPVQNGWHTVIGQSSNAGWNTQIHDEAVFAINAAKVWRMPLGELGGLQTDVLPALGGVLGTLKTDAEAGLTLRIGRGLEDDYGPARIRSLSGGEAFRGSDEIGWYFFAALHGEAVNNDITLSGNNFRSSRSVSLLPLVGDGAMGAALITHGIRVSYTQVIQTQDFKHEKGGAHQFGSLNLSVRF